MNILVITSMFSQPDDFGDNKPTKTVNYFVKEWVDSGNNVVVIHCSSKFPLLYYFVPKFVKNLIVKRTSNIIPPIKSRKRIEREEFGAIVLRIPMLKFFPGQAYSKQSILRTERAIVKALSKMEFVPDAVLGHFANPSLKIVSDLAALYNSKSSIVFHRDCTAKNLEKYHLADDLKRVGAIGVRSLNEAKEVKDLLQLSDMPFICYSGVPNELALLSEKECNKHCFQQRIKHIYVGSIIPRKHLDVNIRAFEKAYSDTKIESSLVIIGGGVEEKHIKDLVTNLNIGDRVHFYGRIDRQEAIEKMKEANIFTLISDDEVFGMVYIEAMLQGCLTIASKGGGFDGIIKDGENGFLCNPGDEEMLIGIYKRIQNMSIQERNAIGNNAIKTAIRFSEKTVAEKYLKDVMRINDK